MASAGHVDIEEHDRKPRQTRRPTALRAVSGARRRARHLTCNYACEYIVFDFLYPTNTPV